jgi:signal transduction histidine kinase
VPGREGKTSLSLLEPLCEVALCVQRARSTEAVLHAAGQGLRELGMDCVVARILGESVFVDQVAIKAERLAIIEDALGRPLRDLAVPLALMPETRQVICAERSFIFDEDFASALADLLKHLDRSVDQTRIEVALKSAGLNNCVLCPLSVNAEPWGALAVAHDQLSSADATAIALFASHLASALEIAETIADLEQKNRDLSAFQAESARLRDEADRRVHLLSVLFDLSRIGTEALEVAPLVGRVLDQASRAIAADASAIYLEKNHHFVLAGCTESAKGKLLGSIPWDERSLCGRAALERRTVVTTLAGWPKGTIEVAQKLAVRHAAAAPLVAKERVIGTLVMARQDDPAFSADEIRLLESCAAQVGTAIDHARLFEDLKISYDALALTQEELLKRERLAALGELSAVVAHEVRNPLGVIFNSLSSLKRVLHPRGDAATLLDIVGEEADRLNRIVGDLLDFARPREPSLQPEDIRAVLNSAVVAARPMAGASGIRLEVRVKEPLSKVPVDGSMLRQALLNLLINAIQAMPGGGTVSLQACEEREGSIAHARIDVVDSGPGVAPEIAQRIFQPFFTTKASGTGLGLAVVRRIIEAHRGEILLESAPGAGARFILRLPLG